VVVDGRLTFAAPISLQASRTDLAQNAGYAGNGSCLELRTGIAFRRVERSPNRRFPRPLVRTKTPSPDLLERRLPDVPDPTQRLLSHLLIARSRRRLRSGVTKQSAADRVCHGPRRQMVGADHSTSCFGGRAKLRRLIVKTRPTTSDLPLPTGPRRARRWRFPAAARRWARERYGNAITPPECAHLAPPIAAASAAYGLLDTALSGGARRLFGCAVGGRSQRSGACCAEYRRSWPRGLGATRGHIELYRRSCWSADATPSEMRDPAACKGSPSGRLTPNRATTRVELDSAIGPAGSGRSP
jgi:hypothetical protein